MEIWSYTIFAYTYTLTLRHVQAIMCVYVHIRLILHVLMITLLMYVHTSNNLYIF